MEPSTGEFENRTGTTPFRRRVIREEDSQYQHICSKTFKTPLGEGHLTASKVKRPNDARLDYNEDDIGVGIDESGAAFTKPARELASMGYNSIRFCVEHPLVGEGFEHIKFMANIWIPGTDFAASKILVREEDPEEEDYIAANFQSLNRKTTSTTTYFLRDEQLPDLNFSISSVPEGGDN